MKGRILSKQEVRGMLASMALGFVIGMVLYVGFWAVVTGHKMSDWEPLAAGGVMSLGVMVVHLLRPRPV